MNFKLCALSILLVSAALPAFAVGRLADVTVIDRNTGATLPVYSHRGEYWVAGAPGARYAISVRSKLGQRLMAVPAVDGINVLSGQTAAWHQTGYVFSSYSQYQITGWRKSDSEVAAFEFAAASDSYAGQTGRPANVGVIGVALFREKQQPQPEPHSRPHFYPELRGNEKMTGLRRQNHALHLRPSARNQPRHRRPAGKSPAALQTQKPAVAAAAHRKPLPSWAQPTASVKPRSSAPPRLNAKTPSLTRSC